MTQKNDLAKKTILFTATLATIGITVIYSIVYAHIQTPLVYQEQTDPLVKPPSHQYAFLGNDALAKKVKSALIQHEFNLKEKGTVASFSETQLAKFWKTDPKIAIAEIKEVLDRSHQVEAGLVLKNSLYVLLKEIALENPTFTANIRELLLKEATLTQANLDLENAPLDDNRISELKFIATSTHALRAATQLEAALTDARRKPAQKQ